MNHIIFTFLFSISPLGEARVGIPYGIVSGLSPVLAYLLGLGGNLLVYPLLLGLVKFFNKKMWRFRIYKQQSIALIRRAKNITGNKIQKYGFWGLMIFVMIPLPVTGAYMGTIAAMIFKIKKRKAFTAISLGVLISCSIIAGGAYLGQLGFKLF